MFYCLRDETSPNMFQIFHDDGYRPSSLKDVCHLNFASPGNLLYLRIGQSTLCALCAKIAVCGVIWVYPSVQGILKNNGAVSKVDKKVFHPTRAQHTLSVAGTVHVSHALPAVRFSCLLRGRGASCQDGVAAVEGFLCAQF
jgi:hypothetical protein